MAMAALSTNPNIFLTATNPLSHHRNTRTTTPTKFKLFSCRSAAENNDQNDHNRNDGEFRLAKLAVATLAAGVLVLGSAPLDAMAGKSGGRVGGQAFRSAAPPRNSAPRSGPRINNSRTNIYINPPVAPPLVGGYGYGVPYYGGWGWSPFSFFAPGPSVAVGFGGGFEFFAAILAFGVVSSLIRRFRRGNNDEDEDDY